MKNDVKNGYCACSGKEILEKWSKNDHFPGPFLQQQG
jgi:hypothetical protein